MPSYRVAWEIDIFDCISPVEAARKAREIQLDPESIATVFTVSQGSRPSFDIDLGEEYLPYLSACLGGEDRCPKCGSHEIEGRFMESGIGEATQTMDCIDCGLSWVDGYRRTGISVIHEGRTP